MKKIKYLSILLSTLFILQSCIDVIDMDLVDAEPRTIIEATLDATDSTCTVTVTKSNTFYDTTATEKLNNLTVKLIDSTKGVGYNLTKNENGDYFGENIVANVGDNFTIVITDEDGISYTASAKTPSAPPMYEIFPGFSLNYLMLFTSITEEPITYIDDDGNEVTLLFALAFWMDDPATENYYRFKIYEDGEYLADSYIFIDDETSFGDTMQMGMNQPFRKGDTVTFELLSINKATYDYFNELQEVLFSGMSSTTPFNPKSNFNNDALGYFCIQQRFRQEFEVQEFDFEF